MEAKVVQFKSYKRKKARNGMTIFDCVAILLNVALVFSLGIGMMYMSFDPPANKFLGACVFIGVAFALLYHSIKVWHIFSKSLVVEYLPYLYQYVCMIMVWSGMFTVFSTLTEYAFFIKVKWFCIFLCPLLFNIFASKQLAKKGKLL